MKTPGILRDRALPTVLDFDALRREGITHIEALGSSLWTNYNPHDPGITLLETLCFAINDLGYRSSFSMKDLLAPAPDKPRPAPGEGPLFSARSILTCHPVTTLDYRKLLVDVEGVRNAWLVPAPRPCIPFYADRVRSQIVLTPPAEQPDAQPRVPRGVYDIVLELADDPMLGSLGDTTWSWQPTPSGQAPLPLELVVPPWDTWRRPEILQQPMLDWEDPWLAETEASSLSTRDVHLVDDQTLETLVRVYVPNGSGTVTRDIPVRVLLRTTRRGSIASWQSFILSELERKGTHNPLHAYRLRLRKAFSVVARAFRTLQSHRNLCEDFREPTAARLEEIALCADVDVTPGADLEAVQARILLVAARLLAPPARFHTLAELLSQDLPVERIFEGPPLDHGFLLDEELAASELRQEVHGSDLLGEILEVEDVVAVRSFSMAAYDQHGRVLASGEPWTIRLEPNALPRLSPDRCKFVFFKRGIPFSANAEETRHKLAFFAEKEGMRDVTRPQGTPLDLEPPTGTWQALDDFRSIQHDLPRVYGIGPEGLPDSADPRRKAQARQLKGYLLFFDQLLGNYLAQLAHLRDQFSLEPERKRTLFAEPLFQRPEFAELFQDGFASTQGTRDTLAEDEAEYTARRDRMLDHLLARFNERFAEYAAVMATLDRGTATDEALLTEKIDFLRDYPRRSAERGKGFDTGAAANLWHSDNVSGLERRVCGLLGIRNCERRDLASHLEMYTEQDQDNTTEYRFRLVDLSGKILLSSSTRYSTEAAVRAEMAEVDKYAPLRERYDLKQNTQGKYYFNLVNPSGEIIARRIESFATREAAEAAITYIVTHLEDMRQREGMHLVEHILLRPMTRDDRLLKVTLEPDCEPCPEDADPYTFRATLVLPAWLERFSRPTFRTFLEQTARQEAPAHVFLKICWVDTDQMRAFEAAFQPWLRERAKTRPDATKLLEYQRALVAALESLRSVHPVATLHDCQEDLGENPLLLGRSQLGTLPTEGD